MITRMDREVGRIVELIESLGLDHDTIYIFSSDNGPVYDQLGGSDSEFFKSAGPFRGLKGSLYEGGVRVPGIVRWRDHIQSNVTSDRVVGFEDWLPTILTLVGAAGIIPPGIDGIDFSATLLGRAAAPRVLVSRIPRLRRPAVAPLRRLEACARRACCPRARMKCQAWRSNCTIWPTTSASTTTSPRNIPRSSPDCQPSFERSTSRLRHFPFLLWTSPSQIWKRIASMPTTSGMKGGGFYDQHSSGQRSSIEILLPWVDDAAATLVLPDRAAPVTLVDYGCSEGRNAILVADRAAEALRRRGAEHSLRAVFADLASNDFNQLFRNLRDEGRLAAQCPGFFPMVVGGSFYAPLMPAGSVHLATTFNAVCWLDRVPAEPLPDFIIYPGPHAHRPDVHVSRSRRVFLASGGR